LTPEPALHRARTVKERQRLAYKAPELLLHDRRYGSEVDMFSLGAVIAEVLKEPRAAADANTCQGPPWLRYFPPLAESDVLMDVVSLVGTMPEPPEDEDCRKSFRGGGVTSLNRSLGIPEYRGLLWGDNSAVCEHLGLARPSGKLMPILRNLLKHQNRWTSQELLDYMMHSSSAAGPAPPLGPRLEKPAIGLRVLPTTSGRVPEKWRKWTFELARLFFSVGSWVVWAAIDAAERVLSLTAENGRLRREGTLTHGAQGGPKLELVKRPEILLAVCLKLAARLDVCRDIFRQDIAGRLAPLISTTAIQFTADDILEAERLVLHILDFEFPVPMRPPVHFDDLTLLVIDCAVTKAVGGEHVITAAPLFGRFWRSREVPEAAEGPSSGAREVQTRVALMELSRAVATLAPSLTENATKLPPLPPQWPIDLFVRVVFAYRPADSTASLVCGTDDEADPSLASSRRLSTASATRPSSRRRSSLSSDRRQKRPRLK
jgi:hypothetical protein